MRTRLLFAAFLLSCLQAAHGQPDGGRRGGPVRLMSYAGVFQENYTDTVLKPFSSARHAGVEFVPRDTSAAMLQDLRAHRDDPQADLVIMDASAALAACAEGLVERIDDRLLPVLSNLYSAARESDDGCGPGVTFDHFVIVYDTRQVSPPPTSLRVLWNPAWKGRIALAAPPNIQGLALTAILASADTADWQHTDEAFEELRELAPSVATFSPQPDGYSMVLGGSVTFATGWNARAQFYRDRSGGRLGVMLPDEGTVFQINTINLVKGAPHRAEALALMAYALSPPAQKAFTERMFYAPTNALAQIDPQAEARTAVSPFNMARIIPMNWAVLASLSAGWQEIWARQIVPLARR